MHGGQCAPPNDENRPLSPKKELLKDESALKGIQADLLKEYEAKPNELGSRRVVKPAPLLARGEAEHSKELMKELLKEGQSGSKAVKQRKKSPSKTEKKEEGPVKVAVLKDGETKADKELDAKLKLESDHDADEEKSGNEDVAPKVKRKKVLKKRKPLGVASTPGELPHLRLIILPFVLVTSHKVVFV